MTHSELIAPERSDEIAARMKETHLALVRALPAEDFEKPDAIMPRVHDDNVFVRAFPDQPIGEKPVVLPEACDESGKVIRPAIDVSNGTLANGQPLDIFYDRGRAKNTQESYFDALTESEIALLRARQDARKLGLLD